MRKFSKAPEGAAEHVVARIGRGDSEKPLAHGWRKPTHALGMAERLARAGEAISISKSRCVVALKRVGAHLGLKPADLMLLDTLAALTQPQDWEERRKPIVWPSNAYLIEQTGFSLSALKRHARRLAESGIIAFQDSPNGKRWGRRDDEGHIIEAYGFDLAPLAARFEEFDALHADLQAERALCQRLKRQITVARRMLRARIETALQGGLRGPWNQFAEHLEGLLAGLPRRSVASETLDLILSRFRELQARVETVFLDAWSGAGQGAETDHVVEKSTDSVKMNPRRVIYEPHIPSTNQLHSVTGNCSENEQAAGVAPKPAPVAPDADDAPPESPDIPDRSAVALDVNTVMQACPHFATWARDLGGYLRDWGDVYRVAGQLRPMIGVSEHAWLEAQDGMGKQAAAAAMALVFDKHCAGEVASPGGYLRGMADKAGTGELHLERSFYGRLSGRAA